MSIKGTLFTGSVVAVLAAGAFFKVGQETQRKSKANWDSKHWLRLLSGANGVKRTHRNGVAPIQTNLVSQGSAPEVKLFWTPEEWLRHLSGQNPLLESQTNSAEIIGRADYSLYR